MKRSKSSRKWLQAHFKDEYVKKAQADGLRSRAAYKLIQLQQRDKFIKPKMRVIELGAAPGSWTELLAKWVTEQGKIIAVDKLSINPINNVQFIQGDFTDASMQTAIVKSLESEVADVVLSDMAPNSSGITSVDQARIMLLNELTLEFALKHLKKNGFLCMKSFQGEGFESLLKLIQQHFIQTHTRKPQASKTQSRELYIMAKGLRN
ncbi:MAG: RlmE family RNA methyltransferase [Pseudomonadota bacterium]